MMSLLVTFWITLGSFLESSPLALPLWFEAADAEVLLCGRLFPPADAGVLIFGKVVPL